MYNIFDNLPKELDEKYLRKLYNLTLCNFYDLNKDVELYGVIYRIKTIRSNQFKEEGLIIDYIYDNESKSEFFDSNNYLYKFIPNLKQYILSFKICLEIGYYNKFLLTKEQIYRLIQNKYITFKNDDILTDIELIKIENDDIEINLIEIQCNTEYINKFWYKLDISDKNKIIILDYNNMRWSI